MKSDWVKPLKQELSLKNLSVEEKPSEFWDAFTKNRFHDYAQQSTKILAQPLPVSRWVQEGDVVKWHGVRFDVFDTPGYTRGAVSYVATIDGKKMAFTGDLIYGDGQLIDLYSAPADTTAHPGATTWSDVPEEPARRIPVARSLDISCSQSARLGRTRLVGHDQATWEARRGCFFPPNGPPGVI